MASNLVAMASNSNLIAMASHLLAMASNLLAMASNLLAVASNFNSDGLQLNIANSVSKAYLEQVNPCQRCNRIGPGAS